MSSIAQIVKAQASPAVRELNPHLFGGRSALESPAVQKLISNMNVRPQFREGQLGKMEQQWLNTLRTRSPQWIGVQCIKLIMAKKTTYTPDFWSLEKGQLIAWEVKGHWEDDARVKIKMAASLYTFIEFWAVSKKGGNFQLERIEP